jgi:hypothetical protein
MENRQKELAQVRELARSYLENPGSIPSAPRLERCRPTLRLWVYPSFEARLAWHVFRCLKSGKESAIVRRVKWDQGADGLRLAGDPLSGLRTGFHATPTVEVRDRHLDLAVLHGYVEELKAITIAMGAGRGTVGIDGTTSGVEVFPGRVLVEWWSVYPPEWEGLVSWAEALREWLDGVCAA